MLVNFFYAQRNEAGAAYVFGQFQVDLQIPMIPALPCREQRWKSSARPRSSI